MENKKKILELILCCVEQLNEQLPKEKRVPREEASKLVGQDGLLDSLSLISLVVDVEERVIPIIGRRVEILESGVLHANGPQFHTLGELVEWICAQAVKDQE